MDYLQRLTDLLKAAEFVAKTLQCRVQEERTIKRLRQQQLLQQQQQQRRPQHQLLLSGGLRGGVMSTRAALSDITNQTLLTTAGQVPSVIIDPHQLETAPRGT